MGLKAAVSRLIIFLLSLPAVQAQTDWRVTYPSPRICAVQGSTVEIRCTYTYPDMNQKTTAVTSRLWFTKERYGSPVDLKADPDYRGRVDYIIHGNVCTLRIRDLREQDSAEYKFRFTADQHLGRFSDSPGVTLSVTELQVQVEPSSSTEAELRCQSSCSEADNPSYVWFKNEEKMDGDTSSVRVSVNTDNRYSCAIRGQESFRSPPVYAPSLPSAFTDPSEIITSTSVTLICNSPANPAAEYSWYKKRGASEQRLSSQQQHYVGLIQPSDSGEYFCEAKNKLGRKRSKHVSISVEYGPKAATVSVSPHGDITENSSVSLTCSSDANPAATYTWYKEQGSRPVSREAQLFFSSIQPSDSGNYYCIAVNRIALMPSTYTNIDVKYAPKRTSVSVRPSAEILEGQDVTLSCSSFAKPPATYTWYKKKGSLGLHHPNTRTQLHLRSMKASDSGEYYCAAENKFGRRESESVSISVTYAPKVPAVTVSPSGEITENSTVTLNCSSDAKPEAKYTWHRINVRGPLSEQSQLVFSFIQASDSGTYYCRAKNKYDYKDSYISLTVKYGPKLPVVSVNPSSEIVEGASVTLSCNSDAKPAAKCSWYRENQTGSLEPVKRHQFTSISSEDRGNYYCHCENDYGSIKSSPLFIDVQFAPKLPSVSVFPSAEIVEGSSVTLTCNSDANPAANYTWYKQQEEEPTASGQILTIRDTRPEHSGSYNCYAKNGRGLSNSTVHLTVVTAWWKLSTAATASAVFLAVILILALRWIIRKNSSKRLPEPAAGPDRREEIQLTEDDIVYTTVRFIKKQVDPVSSNLKAGGYRGPRKEKGEEEEERTVVYSAVKFKSASTDRRTSKEEPAEDLTALYSTVIKRPPKQAHEDL